MPAPPRFYPRGRSASLRLRRLRFCLSLSGQGSGPSPVGGSRSAARPSLPAPAAMAGTLDLDKGCTVEELLRGCIEAFGEWHGRTHPA